MLEEIQGDSKAFPQTTAEVNSLFVEIEKIMGEGTVRGENQEFSFGHVKL